MLNITPTNIQILENNQVFVFGSNAQGNHAGGAARLAHNKFGAKMGISRGMTGDCYAIDTMSGLDVIKEQIAPFFSVASVCPDKTFLVTEIGCGIAGYNRHHIAPLFKAAVYTKNVSLPKSFWDVINGDQENKHLALVTVIITSELYRPMLIHSLLSYEQLDHLMSEVCLECAERFKAYITTDGDKPLIYPRETIINFAKGYIFAEKGIKL